MDKIKPRFKKQKPVYFFREWRKHRGLTQEELADMVGVSPPSISQLERGLQGFTDSTLEALASALNCGPGDLLMRNPLDPETPWSIWDNIKQEDRHQAIRVLKSFAKDDDEEKTGTAN